MAINDIILRLNADGSCEPVKLAGYPVTSSPDGSITVTPVLDPLTGVINYQLGTTNIVYTVAVTNPAGDGDNQIEFTVTGTEQPSGTVVSTQPINFALESGQYFSGQPTIDANGLVTFTTANDDGETVGTPQTLDLSALIDSTIVDASAVDTVAVTYNAATDEYTIAGTSIVQTTDAAGIVTTTFTLPDGSTRTIVSGDDECAEYAPVPTDFDTFKLHGCDSNGKGSTTICEILANMTVAAGFAGG